MTDDDEKPRPMASFVKLLVQDTAASTAFYEALGFMRDAADSVFVHLRWKDHGHVYLVKTPAAAALEGRRGVGILLCFTVMDQNAMQGVESAAIRLHAPVDGPRPTPWHTRELVVTDPDGYRLNFVQPA